MQLFRVVRPEQHVLGIWDGLVAKGHHNFIMMAYTCAAVTHQHLNILSNVGLSAGPLSAVPADTSHWQLTC